MKITKTQLKRIIREEVLALQEGLEVYGPSAEQELTNAVKDLKRVMQLAANCDPNHKLLMRAKHLLRPLYKSDGSGEFDVDFSRLGQSLWTDIIYPMGELEDKLGEVSKCGANMPSGRGK